MRNLGLVGMLALALIGAAGLAIGLGGCSEPTPAPSPVVTPPAVTSPAGAVVLLVNLPTDAELAEYNVSQTLTLQDTEESIIVVSLADDTTIEVVEIEMQDDGNLIELGAVFSVNNVAEGYAFEMIALRPEGAPYYKLRITMADDTVREYYISYNGKDGNPKLEYVFAE